VASGKGGVGKTSLTVNLGLALADLGKRILVVDGDLGPGKIDLLIGAESGADLSQFLSGQCRLEDVMIVGPGGVSFLPAGCGHADLAALDPAGRTRLVEALVRMTGIFDLVLLDLATGIGPNSIELARRADEILLVTTPDPTACADAYAVTKLLVQSGCETPRIVVNRARSWSEAENTFVHLSRTARTHLGSAPSFWGYIPEDPAARDAVIRREPFLVSAPSAPCTLRVRELAWRILCDEPPGGGERALDPLLHAEELEDRPQAA
jgi:flagellar biosynthesis protein FlhG